MTNWKKVEGNGEYEESKTVDFDTDKEIEGRLEKVKHEVGQYKSTVYSIRKISDNALYSVWGNAVINTKMAEVKVGSLVKIVSLGKEKSPKTGRMYSNFDVFFSEGGEE